MDICNGDWGIGWVLLIGLVKLVEKVRGDEGCVKIEVVIFGG